MNDKKINEFNGVNTQMLDTVFESMQTHSGMAKATFSVKSAWNGGFSVDTTAPKGFHIGG
jgi:hypothetical protein